MWQDGANLGRGDYMTINQNKKVIHIITPYDTDIIILNKQLNETYIYFGDKGLNKYQKQAVQDENADNYSSSVSVGRAISKSKRFYKNSTWDLVDKSQDEEIDYASIQRLNLPVELQQLSNSELEEHVNLLSKKRMSIKKKINQLDKKRRVYITNKKSVSAKKDELESVIIKAIKKQAIRKNYSW